MTNLSEHIAQLRHDYQLAALEEAQTGNDPIIFFKKWFQEAEAAQISEVNAMTLATVDAKGKPHARIVLLKGLDEKGFSFFTNYQSNKGIQLTQSKEAALLFFWKELERQVRIEGFAEKISAAESDQYFYSRPKGSQIGASASPQSQKISSRIELEDRVTLLEQKYPDGSVPRPEHWGGYRVIPHKIEFWQGRSNRLHDRIVMEKAEAGNWEKYRIAP